MTHRHHSPLLAGVGRNGKPWANTKIKTAISLTAFRAVLRHERIFVKESAKPNVSWSTAVKKANMAERGSMTKKEWQRHNARLGALERKLKRERK